MLKSVTEYIDSVVDTKPVRAPATKADGNGSQGNGKVAKNRDEEIFLLFFAQLMHDTNDVLDGYVEEYYAGTISYLRLTELFTDTLQGAHTQASYLGRRLAGITTPIGAGDSQFAQSVMFEQSSFIEGLIQDIIIGRYPLIDGALPKDLIARILMYVHRLLGTANEAWVRSLPGDTLLYWTLGGNENHCETCPERAAHGAYIASEVTFFPGDGQSQCLTSCLCEWVTGDGQHSYMLEN